MPMTEKHLATSDYEKELQDAFAKKATAAKAYEDALKKLKLPELEAAIATADQEIKSLLEHYGYVKKSEAGKAPGKKTRSKPTEPCDLCEDVIVNGKGEVVHHNGTKHRGQKVKKGFTDKELLDLKGGPFYYQKKK
jgi:hypothetical protein